MTLDLSPLSKSLTKKSGEEESVRPALVLSLYSDRPVTQLAPFVAEAVREYLAAIPPGVLRSGLVGDNVGPLSTQRVARDLKRLEQPPKGTDYIQIYYSSSETGPPGDFGITCLLVNLDGPRGGKKTGSVRFDFPWDWAEGDRAEHFVDLVTRIAAKVPFTAGTAGFGFSHWHFDRFARDQVYAMLPRYLGFDHSSEVPTDHMRDRTPAAHWLVLLAESMMSALGGDASFTQQVPNAQLTKLANGYLIRTAKHPPVGDINRGAGDLGSIPALANWLKPKRVEFPPIRGNAVELDVPTWLARHDTLENGAWENR